MCIRDRDIPMRKKSSRAVGGPSRKYDQRLSGEAGKVRFSVIDGKKLAKHRSRAVLIGLVLLLALILLVLSLATPVGVSEYFSNGAAKMGAGEGFPVILSVESPFIADSFDKTTTVVGNSTYESFNKNGKQILLRQHGFLNPALEASESRFLIYDLGGTGYSINNMDKLLFSGNQENKIYSADIGRNGTSVFATSSVEYKSQLMVYNSDNENIFNWYSADADLSAVTVSDNGRNVAAATFSAAGGKFASTVYIFDVKKSAPVFSLSLDNSMVVSIKRVGSKAFAVICNNRVVMINWKGEQLYDYTATGTLELVKVCGDHTVLCEGASSNSGDVLVTVIDRKGNSLAGFTAKDTAKDVVYMNKAVYILSDSRISAYTLSGNLAADIPCDFSVSELMAHGNNSLLTVGFGKLDTVEGVASSRLKAADETSAAE